MTAAILPVVARPRRGWAPLGFHSGGPAAAIAAGPARGRRLGHGSSAFKFLRATQLGGEILPVPGPLGPSELKIRSESAFPAEQ